MFANIRGKKIYYQLKGHGQPILLVHGWGGSSQSLEKLADLLSANFQTVLVDLPGFGQSDLPESNWGVEEYSNLIIDFLTSLNLSSIIYFGHSFGGSLGIYIAANYPQILTKLILCDSSFKREKIKTIIPQGIKNMLENNNLLYRLFLFVRLVIYKVFFRRSDLLRYPSLESVFKKLISQDLTPLLSKINAPSLILWGKRDKVTPLSYAYELKEKIKNSRLKIFPEISHNLPIAHPEKVFNEIKKFL